MLRHSMHFRPSTVRLACGALAATLSCIGTTEVCACVHPAQFVLPVAGLVTRGTLPEAGRLVGVAAYAGACPPAEPARDLNEVARFTTTDAAGRYRLEVRTSQAVRAACIRVSGYAAAPSAGGGDPPLLTATERGGFRIDVGPGGGPLDSARVDLTLP